ncbi:MAG: YcxB family protein [Lentisphaeria bacterium]
MKIRYNLTRWDLFTGHWQAMRFSRALHCVLAILGLFIIYSGFTDSQVSESSFLGRLCYTVYWLFLAFGFGFLCALAASALNILLGSGKGLVGEHQLALTDEGLEESTEFNRSLHTWAGLRSLKETRFFYFLFVTENLAHMIPKKKPLLEGDLTSFIEEFKAKMKVAKSAVSPCN